MGGSPTRQEPVTKLRNGCPPRTIPTQHAGPGCQPHPAVPQVPPTLPTACCTYLQDFHALIRAPSVPTLRTACVSALRASHCCLRNWPPNQDTAQCHANAVPAPAVLDNSTTLHIDFGSLASCAEACACIRAIRHPNWATRTQTPLARRMGTAIMSTHEHNASNQQQGSACLGAPLWSGACSGKARMARLASKQCTSDKTV